MKRSIIFWTILLMGMIFSHALFAQITIDDIELHHKGGYLYPEDSILIYPFEQAEIDYRNEDDLLIATRHDYGEGDAWVPIDSFEIYYDGNKNEIRRIKLKWDSVKWVRNLQIIMEYNENNSQTLRLTQKWFGISSKWKNSERVVNTFDSNDNLIHSIDQIWSQEKWINKHQVNNEYDGNNNRTLITIQRWDNTRWKYSTKYSYEYDSNNNIILYSSYRYHRRWVNEQQRYHEYDTVNNLTLFVFRKGEKNDWLDQFRRIQTYKRDNIKTSLLLQDWNGTEWINNSLTVIKYDDRNNDTSTIDQNWNGAEWVNEIKRFRKYDDKNNVTLLIEKKYDGKVWQNFNQIIWKYDAYNNDTFKFYKNWNGIEWVDRVRTIKKYDRSNNNLYNSIQRWNRNDLIWEDYSKRIYQYDEKNNRTMETVKYSIDDVFGNFFRTFYYYNLTTLNSDFDDLNSDFDDLSDLYQIYPNPSEGVFTIKFSNPNFEAYQINVLNLDGQRIYTQNIIADNPYEQVDLTHLPSGAYLLQFLTPNKQSTKKVYIVH